MSPLLSPAAARRVVFLLCLTPVAVLAADDIVVADFEDVPPAGWTVAGEAFAADALNWRGRSKESEGRVGAAMAMSAAGVEKMGTATSPVFTIERDYINLLLNGQRMDVELESAQLLVDGKVVRATCGQNSHRSRDPWGLQPRTWDVRALRGQRAQIRLVDQSPQGGIWADHIVQSDTPATQPMDASVRFAETLRPQFHFSVPVAPADSLLQDPNGLVYYRGQWHLFHQSGSDSHDWAHAVSDDLVHWQTRPVAVEGEPTANIFSGSGVVDVDNRSGMKQGDDDPILLFYTRQPSGALFRKEASTQEMAYSLDGGKTFAKYAGNPILRTADLCDRDPLVFYYPPTRAFLMWLHLSHNDDHEKSVFGLYRCVDPVAWKWEQLQTFKGLWECPDFFELPLDGNPKDTRWVLMGADGNYQVGTFGGRQFTAQTPVLENRWGSAMYAARTFENAPGGRRVQLFYMHDKAASFAGMPFKNHMTFPVDVSLRSTPQGPRLAWSPVPEIEKLYAKTVTMADVPMPEGALPIRGVSPTAADVEAVIAVGDAKQVGLKFRGQILRYDVASGILDLGKAKAAVPLKDGVLKLRVLLDTTSAEVFADGGLVRLARLIFPRENQGDFAFFAAGGRAVLVRAQVRAVKSIWANGDGAAGHAP